MTLARHFGEVQTFDMHQTILCSWIRSDNRSVRTCSKVSLNIGAWAFGSRTGNSGNDAEHLEVCCDIDRWFFSQYLTPQRGEITV